MKKKAQTCADVFVSSCPYDGHAFAVMRAAGRRTARQSCPCDNSRSRHLDFERSCHTRNKSRNAHAGDTRPPAISSADRPRAAGFGSASVPLERAETWPLTGSRRRPARRLRQGAATGRRSEALEATTRRHDSEDCASCLCATELFHVDELDDCLTPR